MKICSSIARAAAAFGLFLLVGLAGCNPIGDGTGPVRLGLNGPTGVVDATTGRVFECIRTGISATLYFDNGSAADFTGRVRWTSSNPAAVRVSNGDEPSTDGNFFAAGVLTPVAPGTSTITANFSEFSDSIVITVGTPSSLTVQLVNPQTEVPAVPVGNTLRIGPSTVADLAVIAVVDNIETNVDGAATWSFDVPNTAVATIAPGTGVITAVAAGGPLIARAAFAPCSMTAATTINVAPITAITTTAAYGGDAIVLGNTEKFTTLADFGTGPEQDISLQSTSVSSSTTAAVFSAFPGLTNLLSTIGVGGPFNVTTTFTSAGTVLTAPPLMASVVADTLQSISLQPATASVVAGSSTFAQFRVLGTYASGRVQDISRLATYTSSDLAVGSSRASVQNVGQFLSTGLTPGTATITATVIVSTSTPATTLTSTATFTTTAPPAP